MFNKTVVVVDDESDIRELLNYNLSKEGYIVKTFPNPINGLEYLQHHTPDIILSDWLMPEMDGLEFCRTLKMDQNFSKIPMIMITCKGDESDIVSALELGADDYLVKPFRIKELIARMRKVIRKQDEKKKDERANPAYGNVQNSLPGEHSGEHFIATDHNNYQVILDGIPMELTISEFKILSLLIENPGKIYSRAQLIHRLNGEDYLVTDRTIDVKIVGIRKKLGKYQKCIVTIRSVGYKFEMPEDSLRELKQT